MKVYYLTAINYYCYARFFPYGYVETKSPCMKDHCSKNLVALHHLGMLYLLSVCYAVYHTKYYLQFYCVHLVIYAYYNFFTCWQCLKISLKMATCFTNSDLNLWSMTRSLSLKLLGHYANSATRPPSFITLFIV